MNDLQEFVFEGKDIRIVTVDNEPWWVLKDVCNVLGLSDASMTAARLDEDEKLNKLDLSSLGQRGGWIINESGLYSVIMRSDKPDAKRFRKWVTSEVLPSIRKTGGYLSPKVDFSDPDNIQKILDQWKADREKLLETQDRLDTLMVHPRMFTSSEIAKELHMTSAMRMHSELREKGIFMKNRRGYWMFTASYVEEGAKYRTDGYITLSNGIDEYWFKWTPAGREWLINTVFKGRKTAPASTFHESDL